MQLNVPNEHHRSNAVTTFQAPDHDLNKLREWVEVNLGLTIGVSLGFDSEEYLDGKSVARIGHMGHLNPHMLIGVISSLEIGMTAQNIPHKSFAAEKIYDLLNS